MLALYVVAAAALFTHYQYRLNPDGVSYVSIAEKYARGDALGAINRHWAPLLSWLTAPAIYFGVPGVAAAKVWLLVAGLAALAAFVVLLRQFEVTGRPRAIALASALVCALSFALTLVTPDVLTVALLAVYYCVIWSSRYTDSRWAGALCGLLGALAYLAKNYNFYFFFAHFAAMTAWLHLRSATPGAKRTVLLNAATGYAVFLVLSSVWIGMMAHKYGELTIGSAGKYNLLAWGPDSNGQPMDNGGFLAPPNPTAVSMWEDPSLYMDRMKPWNPLGSWRGLKHALLTTLKNAGLALSSGGVIFSVVLLVLARRRNVTLASRVYWLILSVTLYAAGYLPLIVEDRYLWSSKLLGLVLCAALLGALAARRIGPDLRPRRWPYVLYLLMFVSAPLAGLITNWNGAKEYFDIAQRLRSEFHVQGNIASSRGMWHRSLQAAYYMDAHYYGQPAPDIDGAALEKELAHFDIDYYFVWALWDPLSNKMAFPATGAPANLPEIAHGAIPNLRVYACKSSPGG